MEVTFILNIRERNDCAKDRQSKYRVASTGQHQMVQKFVKELNDSTKQSEQPSNAERTATEQVETTAREIVHEAVQLPRRAIQHTARRESADSSANSQPEQSDQPHPAPESPRERTDAPRTRPDAMPPQSAPAPTPQEQARRVYVQQAAKEGAPAPSIMPEQPRERHVVRSAPLTENTPRQRTEDVRTHSAPKQRQSAPTAQEQGRRAYVKRAKKSRAEKSSARDNLYTEQAEIRLADDMPQSVLPPIREKPTFTELRGEPRPEPTPENASNVQHTKQTGTWTPRGTEPYSRGIEQPIRERPAVTPAHDLPSAPQEQGRQHPRRLYLERADRAGRVPVSGHVCRAGAAGRDACLRAGNAHEFLRQHGGSVLPIPGAVR